jgi:hypothetical protein
MQGREREYFCRREHAIRKDVESTNVDRLCPLISNLVFHLVVGRLTILAIGEQLHLASRKRLRLTRRYSTD